MPGVKWSLECETNGSIRYSQGRYAKFNIIITTDAETVCKIDFEAIHGKEKCSTKESFVGQKHIELKQIDVEEIFKPSNYYFSGGKFIVEICGAFSYKEASTNLPIICTPEEWKLRLIQKLPQNFEIIVGDEVIKIIKILVAAESDVFERMFEGNFTEEKENKATIEGYTYETVKSAIDYCYGQNIGIFITSQENAVELLNFANQYNFVTLKPKLEKYFAKNLTTENIEIFALISDKANAMELRQSCVNFVQSLFNTSPKWPNGELPEFDSKFMRDVVSQALTKKL